MDPYQEAIAALKKVIFSDSGTWEERRTKLIAADNSGVLEELADWYYDIYHSPGGKNGT